MRITELRHGILDRQISRELRGILKLTGEKVWRDKIAKRKCRPSLSRLDLYGRYLDHLNPLVPAIEKFLTLEAAANSVWKHPDIEVMRAASWAYLINRLVGQGNEEVRKRVIGSLLDDSRVRAFLFELDMATHFFRLGYDLEFMDLLGRGSYDFLVSNGRLELEVECKRKSADAGRKISRGSFYMLSDIIIGQLAGVKRPLLVTLTCDKRLGSNQETFRQVAGAIGRCVDDGASEASVGNIRAKIVYLPQDLRLRNDDEARNFLASHLAAGAHHSIFTNRDVTIVIRCESAERDRVLKAIYDDLKEGVKQFSGDQPALLCCFVEDIDDDDWEQLRHESGLAAMTGRLLLNPERSHTWMVSYSSDQTPPRGSGSAVEFSRTTLHFENPRCKFIFPKAFVWPPER